MTDKPAYSEKEIFNEWLDENYSDAKVVELGVKPSLILYELQYEQYELLEQDYLQQKCDALIDKVSNEYPFPIAYPFYRYMYGSENNYQQLNFMRDTWESTLHVIQSLVVGLSSVHNRKLPWKRLCTWSIGNRLKNCEDLLDFLIQEQLIDQNLQEAVSIIKNLNSDVRNEFSHSLTLSSDQVLALIHENESLFFKMLEYCDSLSDFQYLRFKGTGGSLNIQRYEIFKSHASTPAYINIDAKEFIFHFSIEDLSNKILIFRYGQEMFLASPLTHINVSDSGHQTNISLLRSIENDNLKYQDVDGTSPYFIEQTELKRFIAQIAKCPGDFQLEQVH